MLNTTRFRPPRALAALMLVAVVFVAADADLTPVIDSPGSSDGVVLGSEVEASVSHRTGLPASESAVDVAAPAESNGSGAHAVAESCHGATGAVCIDKEAFSPPIRAAVVSRTEPAKPRPEPVVAPASVDAGPAAVEPEPREENAPAGESLEPGRYEEWSDNGSFSAWPGTAEGSAMQMTEGTSRRLDFLVYLHCEDSGSCSIAANLSNTSGRLMRFERGLAADVYVTRCEGAGEVSTIRIEEFAIVELAPGAAATLSGSVALTTPGQYCATARTWLELVQG